jgi:hypothetical protein
MAADTAVTAVVCPVRVRTKPGQLFPSREDGPQCAALLRVCRGMPAPADNLCIARSHRHRYTEDRRPGQHSADGMRRSQPNVGSRLHRDLTPRYQRPPQPIQRIEQKQPGRAHQRLRLGNPNLRTMVIAKHLRRPLRRFHTGNLVKGLDCVSGDP